MVSSPGPGVAHSSFGSVRGAGGGLPPGPRPSGAAPRDDRANAAGEGRGAGTHGQTLGVVVARLLAVALMLTKWLQSEGQAVALSVPQHYRMWPMVEIHLESFGRRLRFYVCPEAATLSDDQPFLVGTTFVVETHRLKPADKSLVSRFVMRKYAGAIAGKSQRMIYGTWSCSVSGPKGELSSMLQHEKNGG